MNKFNREFSKRFLDFFFNNVSIAIPNSFYTSVRNFCSKLCSTKSTIPKV